MNWAAESAFAKPLANQHLAYIHPHPPHFPFRFVIGSNATRTALELF
jgi:hypothetical protein